MESEEMKDHPYNLGFVDGQFNEMKRFYKVLSNEDYFTGIDAVKTIAKDRLDYLEGLYNGSQRQD